MIKKFCSFIFSFLLIVTCVFGGCGCDDNGGGKEQLPKYLFNSKGVYICHFYNGYLYNKNNNMGVAYYNEDYKIFISLNGKYFGEIKDTDLLLYNNNSTYKNMTFEKKSLPPMSPTQPTPPTHKTPKTQPSGWRDVIIYGN